MKFVSIWVKTAAENVTLKVGASLLAAIAVSQLFAIITLSSRDAIVVERGCYSSAAKSGTAKHTTDEIRAFLSEALPIRFSTTEEMKANYLSPEQAAAKLREENALKAKQISQKFIFLEATVSDNEITATGDRIIALGAAKSVLPLKVKVSVAATTRSEANPYGLILTEVSQIDEKK